MVRLPGSYLGAMNPTRQRRPPVIHGGMHKGGQRSGLKPLLWGEPPAFGGVGGTCPAPACPRRGKRERGRTKFHAAAGYFWLPPPCFSSNTAGPIPSLSPAAPDHPPSVFPDLARKSLLPLESQNSLKGRAAYLEQLRDEIDRMIAVDSIERPKLEKLMELTDRHLKRAESRQLWLNVVLFLAGAIISWVTGIVAK